MKIMGTPRKQTVLAMSVGLTLIGSPVLATPPGPGPVTTACRVKIEHAVLGSSSPVIESANGAINPGAVRPAGGGAVQVELRDGRQISLIADRLICRRDGGVVPQHGGANIADSEGNARIVGNGSSVIGRYQMHVEDRGSGRELEDYLALRISDSAGDELLFDANYLVSGDIQLIPTRPGG